MSISGTGPFANHWRKGCGALLRSLPRQPVQRVVLVVHVHGVGIGGRHDVLPQLPAGESRETKMSKVRTHTVLSLSFTQALNEFAP